MHADGHKIVACAFPAFERGACGVSMRGKPHSSMALRISENELCQQAGQGCGCGLGPAQVEIAILTRRVSPRHYFGLRWGNGGVSLFLFKMCSFVEINSTSPVAISECFLALDSLCLRPQPQIRRRALTPHWHARQAAIPGLNTHLHDSRTIANVEKEQG